MSKTICNKQSLWEVLVDLSRKHVKFEKGGYCDLLYFNQFTKTISNGNVVLVKGGHIRPQTLRLRDGSTYELVEDMPIFPHEDEDGDVSEDVKCTTSEDVIDTAEKLYHAYKYSVPSPIDDFARSNFIALEIDKIGWSDFIEGSERSEARVKLETFVMFNKFPVEEGKHYWQSPKEKGLIVFKEWQC